MERIADRAGDAPIGLKAAITVAESYERRRKFNEAYHKWSQVLSQQPGGQTGKEALLSMGRCKHAAYRGPKYGASNLISAKSYYENFRFRHPAEADKFDIDRRLEQIDEQLAYKQFSIGRYYQQTDSEQASNLYFQMVIDNWPGSTVAEMAKKAMNEEKSGGKKEKKWKQNIIEKLEKLLL
jgi:outer membrane protein assembly factor BamD (BamD/ComL family)